MATRFDGKVFTFTQPDGTPIQAPRVRRSELRGVRDARRLHRHEESCNRILRAGAVERRREHAGAGDESRGAARRRGGRIAARPARHARKCDVAAARRSALATAGRRCDQRREEKRQQMRALRAMAPPAVRCWRRRERETVGDFVGLCLLIDFSDAPATIARDEVDRFCNQPGYNGFGNNGSVSDFFRDNSIGRCRYTNIVAPYYRAQHPKTFYTDRRHPAAAARGRADQRSAGAPQGGGIRLLGIDRRQPGIRVCDQRVLCRAGHQQLGRGPLAARPPSGHGGAAGTRPVGVRLPVHGDGCGARTRDVLSRERPHAVRLSGPVRLRQRVERCGRAIA